MSRVSPNPECLPDTRIQTRAKSARIQSQRPLSHESTIDPPTLLNKPLEVGMPTSSGFKSMITKSKLKMKFIKRDFFKLLNVTM